jgi:acyl transferase domain-containing protein/acyl carrier protein/2-polyprenyl-3-methyl-5-hydroxy-6-metoxy-1,4-benzoquinol methylase
MVQENLVPRHDLNGFTATPSSSDSEAPEGSPSADSYPPHAIAIVGMAGRFPGADTLEELWDVISEGKVMVEKAPERVSLPKIPGKQWWGNFLNDHTRFDNKFFKKSSREALAWDPQQRILLEVVYEALESAGYYGPKDKDEPEDYGFYIGAAMNNYYDNVSCHPPTAYATVGTSRCYLSGAMSHQYGWTGPSLTIDTGCSSSLVAINSACRAILSGECSRAIAGGTNVISSPFDYQNLNAAGFLSPSGQCKPFDSNADGYCRGEAVAVVVLKPLATAIEDGDNIVGVVTGFGANQNINDSHITVPNSGSQSTLYRKVMSDAGTDPAKVSYVEAHGTGTGVGDPVEVGSIRDTFGSASRDSVLHFASIKGNIGHTEATAGVAGLMKVLLMMQHGKIPPQASHHNLNPKIAALEPDRIAIPRSLKPWKEDVKLALVNSYGAAGSNSAIVVAQGPSVASEPSSTSSGSALPLIITASSANSLSMYRQKLREWLSAPKRRDQISVTDLAFSLSDRANHSFPYKLVAEARSIQDLNTKLQENDPSNVSKIPPSDNPIILVFGGQESEFIGLSEELYKSAVILRRHLDHCNETAISLGYDSLFPSIFQTTPVQDIVSLHLGLFAIQYATARSWIDCGLKIKAVVGHSFGQLTALCVSGSLSLTDAVKLIAGRAVIMQKYWGKESGSMLFVQTTALEVEDILTNLRSEQPSFAGEIACYNGSSSHVVVGTAEEVDELEQFIAKNVKSVRTKKLSVTHGFHSRFTDSLLPHLDSLANELNWNRPSIHIATCTKDQDVVPSHSLVAQHTRQPVYFQAAIERLSREYPQSTWIEAGRGSSVMQLVKGCVHNSSNVYVSPKLTTVSAANSLLDSTLALWKHGHAVQYWPFHRSQRMQYKFLDIPSYQFEKGQHWLGFTGRVNGQDNSAAAPAPAQAPVENAPQKELMRFLKYSDSSKKGASFNISPYSERFKTMLAGHVMSNQTLAPASLYYEIVARAALYMENDTDAKVYLPTVENLRMFSPIGNDESKTILATFERIEGSSRPSWTFSVTTQGPATASGSVAKPFEHSSGSVTLSRRDDLQAEREFRRFETLTGVHRYDEIMNHPDVERMQGRHVYKAFDRVVTYSPAFQGIKAVGCLGYEAVGKVVATPNPNDPADQRLCDTPMSDSLMQFSGFLANYFHNSSAEDLFVCHTVDYIQLGSGFSPDTGEWICTSTMRTEVENHPSVDVYVFDPKTKKMVMAAFGFGFSKMSRALLARLLKGVNVQKDGSKEEATAKANIKKADMPVFAPTAAPAATPAPTPAIKVAKQTESKRADLFQILHNVTDIPIDELRDQSTLEELGVDSLGATEVLNDIRTILGLTIDLSSFLFFTDVGAIVAHIDEKLGLSGGVEESAPAAAPVQQVESVTNGATNGVSNGTATNGYLNGHSNGHSNGYSNGYSSVKEPVSAAPRPTIESAYEAFDAIRLGYDRLAESTKAAGFWEHAYPEHARLVEAYTMEAFAKLGCDLNEVHPGNRIPEIKSKCLDTHTRLLGQLHKCLEDGGIIERAGDGWVRTKAPLDTTPAEQRYQNILGKFPQHDLINHLTHVIGSEMAECLVGDKVGLQIVFGNKKNKKLLEDMYEWWPILRVPTLQLGDFLAKALSTTTDGGKFKILEIGAGTGGTTRYVVNHLRNLGIPFEYTFTDISSSLVTAAKKTLKGDEMRFKVVDLEKEPAPEDQGEYHIILASNVVHATRYLDQSLTHIRQMLSMDGALAVIEFTSNMWWLDIVFGLLEGWGLFQDGRTHALVDEKHWERAMKGAGFRGGVLWTEGKAPESTTVRVIAGFLSAPLVPSAPLGGVRPGAKKSVKAKVHEVPYKTLANGKEVIADIYVPDGVDSTRGKLPIGEFSTCDR